MTLSENMQKELFTVNLINLQGRICKTAPSTTAGTILSMARDFGVDPKEAANCRTSYLKDALCIKEGEVASICGITAETDGEAALIEAWQTKEKEGLDLVKKELAYLRKVEKGEERRDDNGLTDEMIAEAKNRPFTDFIEFQNGTAKCPFHTEKTGSLHLYPSKNGTAGGYIHCFGCQKGWTNVDYVKQLHNLNYPQAIRFLALGELPDPNAPRPVYAPANNRPASYRKKDPDVSAATNIGFEYYTELPDTRETGSGLDYEAETINDTNRAFVYE